MQKLTTTLLIACFAFITGCPQKKKVVKTTPKVQVVKVTQPEEFYNLGIDALAQNDLDKAASNFRQALAKIEGKLEWTIDYDEILEPLAGDEITRR